MAGNKSSREGNDKSKTLESHHIWSKTENDAGTKHEPNAMQLNSKYYKQNINNGKNRQ